MRRKKLGEVFRSLGFGCVLGKGFVAITQKEFWEKGIIRCVKDVEIFLKLTAEEG